MSEALVLLSGGIDSVVAAWALKRVDRIQPRCVFFEYGQRHMLRERTAAHDIARLLDDDLLEIDLRKQFASIGDSSALTGHGKDLTGADVVVAGRNMIFISIAMAVAQARGIRLMAYGATGSDQAIFADCRPEFVRAMADVTAMHGVMLNAPWVHLSKASVIAHGNRIGAPLGLSYSCYAGGAVHCGECLACRERIAGFAGAGIADPTIYASRPARCPICDESGLMLQCGDVFRGYEACRCQ